MSIAETKYKSALKNGYMELPDEVENEKGEMVPNNAKYYDLPGKAGSESTTGEKTNYKFYNRVDATGDDQGNIQVWTKDDKDPPGTQHIGTYKKDADGSYTFEKNATIRGGPHNEDPRVLALEKKGNQGWGKDGTQIEAGAAKVVQEQAGQNVKDWTKTQCEAAGGTDCVQEAEKDSQDLMLSEKQNEALQKAAQEEGETEESIKAKEETLSSDVDNAQMRKDYEDIVYPIDLNSEYQDFIQFQMIEYVPRKFSTGGTGTTIPTRNTPGLQTLVGDANGKKSLLKGTGNAIKTGDANLPGGKGGERKILATMTLPIPAGIGDQNGVDWGQDQVNQLDTAIANLAGDVTAGGGQGSGRDFAGALKSPGTGEAVRAGAVSATLSGTAFTQREYGAVLNKNMELLFNGPRLRGFSFTFRMSPRNADEAKAVRGIIRQFKQGMSPKKGQTFTFIKAPHTFFIGYYHKGSTSPWLNMFKECALESMTMNYTPDGQYSTFHDGALTSYEMQLGFKELEPVFDSDYDEGTGGANNDFIGY